MPNTENHRTPRRRGWLGLGARTAASWSVRAPNGASSALAPAPGVAGEEAGRQRAPEPGEGVAEPNATSAANPSAVRDELPAELAVPSFESSARPPLPVEQLSWREPDAPVLPARLNRRRTTEKRDQEKKIRFTATAVRLIDEAAKRRRLTFAGFVGDATLAVALGKANMTGSPEDDPVRPLVEAVESHIKTLNRIGTNLNQITMAINSGAVPEQTEVVLDHVDQAVQRSYELVDELVAEGGAGHGA
ncbi:plasmid mobilization relaxosome protein MobC [Streptomyces buecherae]|uniref:Plasmid mobilization relaxosome protein MobC n=1 Tax=Streptomyces buecherae TaxID=2763006 RepID=A0A7H8N4Y5_9ACTN|nr:plasmid mobilization relaxosome protein MobC [Streptomyces buecherae]